jgi:hypothetical protein
MFTYPVDDVEQQYSQADQVRRNAVSAVLQSNSFILQTEEDYSVIVGADPDKAVGLLASVLFDLRREYGDAFVRSFIKAVSASME